MDEPDAIKVQNLSESITFMRGNIEAQETQLELLFGVDTLEAIQISLPKVPILQTILEELFQCSTCGGHPKRGALVVSGDLGDILAQIIRHTTEENREELAGVLNWIESEPERVVFPYVNYVETT